MTERYFLEKEKAEIESYIEAIKIILNTENERRR